MADHETSPVTSPAPPAQDAKPPVPPQEKPAAPPAEPQAEREEGTFDDDQFSRQQLIRHARELVGGAEPYEVEVALRHAGGADYFTKAEAKAAVKELLQATALEDPDTEGEDA